MSEYTPTTNGVRNRYLWWYEAQQDRRPSNFTKYPDEVLAEFDRWLEAHDAEVRAEFQKLCVLRLGGCLESQHS